MKQAEAYIKKITSFDMIELGKPAGVINRLPLFIKAEYKFFCAELNSHEVVLVEPEAEDKLKPNLLKKHIPKIESAFECPAILVFKHMSYYMRENLTDSRIAFIVPGEQLFIPFMFISLREQQHIKRTKTEKYSPSAQCMLIYHLWKMPLDELNFQEIADLFLYTARTIGRSARELEDSGVCQIVGSKAKNLEFKTDKWEIWNMAKEYMRSPVTKPIWLLEFKQPEKTQISGINALAKYSNISPTENDTVYAVERTTYNKMEYEGKVMEDPLFDSSARLQLWSYDPAFLAKDEYVDPFSLYLTLQHNPDERVQISLDKMIERVL